MISAQPSDSIKTGNFSSSWISVYCSKKILSCWVSYLIRTRNVLTRYMANPMVRHSVPILRCDLWLFCISATMTVHLLSSSSSSGSTSVMRYCGLCQNVSITKKMKKLCGLVTLNKRVEINHKHYFKHNRIAVSMNAIFFCIRNGWSFLSHCNWKQV
jgi:hypothetical protein